MDDLASLLRMSGCLVVDSRLKFFQTVVFLRFYISCFFPNVKFMPKQKLARA